MGQRLNVSIITNDGVVANCYMHWSGYPGSALEIGEILIPKFQKNFNLKDELNLKKEVVNILKANLEGSELCDKRDLELLGLKDFTREKNRNDGLISVTKEGILETESLAEGTLEINIEDKQVYCDLLSWLETATYDDILSFEQISEDEVEIRCKHFDNGKEQIFSYEEVNFNFYDTNFEEFLELADILLNRDSIVIKDYSGELISNNYME